MNTILTYFLRTLCLLGLFHIILTPMTAQVNSPDTLAEERKGKDPLKATLFSAFIPGAGQVYNGGWHLVKVPAIYGGFGALVYAVRFNRDNYRDFNTAYEREVNGLDHKYSDLNITADGLRSQRDYYRKNLELSYIGMSLLYIANIADAFVSAHLSTFDVSEDLSLRLNPYSETTASREPITGITLTLSLQ